MIAGEEGRLAQGVEQRNDFVAIFHAQPPDFGSDLPHVHTPSPQAIFFWQADVLIQDAEGQAVFLVNDSRANSTASAIAAWLSGAT